MRNFKACFIALVLFASSFTFASQASIVLPTTGTHSGLDIVSRTNNALGAVASMQSGASDPGAIGAYTWWADTTAGIIKQRNSANSAWLSVMPIGTSMETAAHAASTYALISGFDVDYGGGGAFDHQSWPNYSGQPNVSIKWLINIVSSGSGDTAVSYSAAGGSAFAHGTLNVVCSSRGTPAAYAVVANSGVTASGFSVGLWTGSGTRVATSVGTPTIQCYAVGY